MTAAGHTPQAETTTTTATAKRHEWPTDAACVQAVGRPQTVWPRDQVGTTLHPLVEKIRVNWNDRLSTHIM